MTLAYVRKHGFSTDTEKEMSQNKVVMAMFEKARPLIMGAVKRDAQATAKLDFLVVDPPATVGYLLLGLREQKQKPVDTLTGLAQYLAMDQQPAPASRRQRIQFYGYRDPCFADLCTQREQYGNLKADRQRTELASDRNTEDDRGQSVPNSGITLEQRNPEDDQPLCQ
jgi:hypothetical protein